MSHLRVLICRVDEDDDEQVTEVARVDLPAVPGQWGTRRWNAGPPRRLGGVLAETAAHQILHAAYLYPVCALGSQRSC